MTEQVSTFINTDELTRIKKLIRKMEKMLDVYSDLIDFYDTKQFGIDSYNYLSLMKEKDRIIDLIEEKLDKVDYNSDGLSIDVAIIDDLKALERVE